MDFITQVVIEQLCVLRGLPRADAAALDLSQSLFDHYGISSLEMVLLMTDVCEKAAVPMTDLTEVDIAQLKTPSEIVTLLRRHGGAERSA